MNAIVCGGAIRITEALIITRTTGSRRGDVRRNAYSDSRR
jgi:hypothetical protein